MTGEQINRYSDFKFGFLDDREVRWKKSKNGFHNHGQFVAIWC